MNKKGYESLFSLPFSYRRGGHPPTRGHLPTILRTNSDQILHFNANTIFICYTMSAQAALPSAEALALSAAAFSASIDAWIPAGWGASSSGTSKSSELTLSGFGGADDRLGLGHPLLDQANKRPATSGLGALGKNLAKRPKRDDEPISVPKLDDDESEEEESRAGAFKSKSTGRGRGLEMLSQRKKQLKGAKEAKEAEHPAALLSKAPTTSSPSSLVAVAKGDSTEIEAAGTEKFEPPASNHSERTNTRGTEAETAEGVASDEKREGKEDDDDDDDSPQAMRANGGDGRGTLSKTQQRRLKRKAAKLAKKARQEAGKRK